MSGTLYVVATPIGNLEDITLRALRVLREVDVIAAEDTRRTARLLSHHGISTPAVSFHKHNARARVPKLVHRLESGESIAVVSDAGTPGVSDPGLELVRAALQHGIRVEPIPGASAPLTALVASGFPMVPFTVLGFPPHRSNDRKHWLKEASAVAHTFAFFESPHRIASTLTDAIEYLGNRQIVVGRELTKLHQEFLHGTASELVNLLSAPRGEFTVVVGPSEKTNQTNEIDQSDSFLADEFCRLTESGGPSRRALITDLARRSGRRPKDVYSAIEKSKKLVE